MLTDLALLRLLQLTDTAFPVGAFAHSFGLETYVARGTVNNAATLAAFIANTLRYAVAPSDGVACVAVMRAGKDWETVVQRLDQRLTATKVVSEFRLGSRTMGMRFLRTATQLFPLPHAKQYLELIEAKQLHGHLSLAYGLTCRDLELLEEYALAGWLRQYGASLVSAGVRLIPLGQTQGQALLACLGTTIIDLVERTLGQTVDDMTSFVPGQELAGIIHRDLLTTRLYIS